MAEKQKKNKNTCKEYFKGGGIHNMRCRQHPLQVKSYLVIGEFCHRLPLLLSWRTQQCKGGLKKNSLQQRGLTSLFVNQINSSAWTTLCTIQYFKPCKREKSTLWMMSQKKKKKRYLKILFNWSSTSFPGNKGLPALASSKWGIKMKHS